MKVSCLVIATVILFSGISTPRDDWQGVTTADGVLHAMLPGKPTDSETRDKTIAGTVVTKIKSYSSKSAQYSISSTKLSKIVQRFADEQTLFDNAKAGVLKNSHGKATSFDNQTLNGIPGRLLKYAAVSHDDENHRGFEGLAFIFVHEGTVYTADVLAEKAAGEADVRKFRDSIRIK